MPGVDAWSVPGGLGDCAGASSRQIGAVLPRLLVISGPSCAGKSPLCRIARRTRPDLFEDVEELVLSHSRAPRPHETDGVDYRFRTREAIEDMRGQDGVAVWKVRDDLQALAWSQLDEKLERASVLYEGNFRIAMDLQARHRDRCLSLFVSPLARVELEAWREQQHAPLPESVTELMRRRLLRRAHGMKPHLGLPDLKSIERRASDAIEGLRHADRFDWVLPNHDGEDSDHWDLAGTPIGDARLSVEALVGLLEGGRPERLERWDETVVPR